MTTPFALYILSPSVYIKSWPLWLSEMEDWPSNPEPNALLSTVGVQLSKSSEAARGRLPSPELLIIQLKFCLDWALLAFAAKSTKPMISAAGFMGA